ncbi:hypothetical protein NVP1225O_28 [Vibrio phage 1.225.O._10N.261.48.B7]|nr:hypothetical protein NVP1225O_28 [Vibrio phage 1.225.O._10N.261.48.B7]
MSYKTYQEAKIAMPLACIIHDTGNDRFFGMPSREGTTLTNDGCKFAEPQDYCMTVEKFLADGYKFVEGDILLGTNNNLVTVGLEYTVDIANVESMRDFKRYILHSAALENQMNIDKVETQTEHQEEMSAFKSNPVIQLSIDELDKFDREPDSAFASINDAADSAEWNGEGLPPVGVECRVLLDCSGKWKLCDILFSSKESVVVVKLKSGAEIALDPFASSFRKPETKQQREDRERLEAAYELYCIMCAIEGYAKFDLTDFSKTKKDSAVWLAIVDKTNYRKGVK